MGWVLARDKDKYGVAIQNFEAANEMCLKLRVGDTVHVLEVYGKDWAFGYVTSNVDIQGTFPRSCIQTRECRIDKSGPVERVFPVLPPVIQELTNALRQWRVLLRQAFMESKDEFIAVFGNVENLIFLRKKILSDQLPLEETRRLRQEITRKIDLVNRLLGLDLVVRDEEGRILDCSKTSTTRLFRRHTLTDSQIALTQSSGASADNSPRRKPHLSWTAHVHFTNIILKVPVACEVSVTLQLREAEDRLVTLTEPYVFQWTPGGYSNDNDLYDKLQVMYTDLGSRIVSESSSVWLVGVVVQLGKCHTTAAERRKSTVTQSQSAQPLMRADCPPAQRSDPSCILRPYGAFAVEVTEVLGRQQLQGTLATASLFSSVSPAELRARFLPCGEKESLKSVVRRVIEQNNDGRASDEWIVFTIILHNGDILTLRTEHPHHLPFREVKVAPRLCLAEVIIPGFARNDLYITLVGAEVSRGNKMSDKNVEVSVTVYDADHNRMENALCYGAEESGTASYRSVTYYHEGKPQWHETFKLAIPIERYKGAHIRFTLNNRSLSEGKEKLLRPFALAFVQLMQDNGTTLDNKQHELYLYNVDQKKWQDDQFDYLQLPWLRSSTSIAAKIRPVGNFTLAQKDSFTIATVFCSTRLTQNVELLKLLEWTKTAARNSQEDGKPIQSQTLANELIECLSKLKHVPREELLTFLKATLDVLLQLLAVTNNTYDLDNAVFEALVEVVYIAGEQLKGEAVQPELNSYINNNFTAENVYSKLILLLKDYIDKGARITSFPRAHRQPSSRTVSSSSLEKMQDNIKAEDNISLPDKDRTFLGVPLQNGHSSGSGGDVSQREASTELHIILNKALKCLPYLFKFIVKSRELYISKNLNEKNPNDFSNALHMLFTSLASLMENTADVVVSSRGQCLRYLSVIIPDVVKVFDRLTFSECLINILASLHQGQLTPQKLTTMCEICHSELFDDDNCREKLLSAFVAQIKTMLDSSLQWVEQKIGGRTAHTSKKVCKLLGSQPSSEVLNQATGDQPKRREIHEKAVEMLEDMLDMLHRVRHSPYTQIHTDELCRNLLPKILTLARLTPVEEPVLSRYVVVLMGMVRQWRKDALYRLIVGHPQKDDSKEDLTHELVDAINTLLDRAVFKPDWAQLILLLNHILLQLLEVSAESMIEKFKNPFRRSIWKNWFHCCVKFICQPALQLERFMASKRKQIRSSYGEQLDMRMVAALTLKQMWHNLGEHKASFVVGAKDQSLVGPVLRLTLIPEPELRKATIPLVYEMMRVASCTSTEGRRSSHSGAKTFFEDFEREVLVCLDDLVVSGQGDDHYSVAFEKTVGGLVEGDLALRDRGEKFVRTICQQLKCLLQYRSILHSPAHSAETRMCCTVYLLDFYTSFLNKELYVRYINKLVDLHIAANNCTEAGFALYEHAKILKWEHVRLTQALMSSRHKHVEYHDQLKELLYEDIIDLMEKGQMWECALERCKELMLHYETMLLDYSKLPNLLHRMSECYTQIMSTKNVRPASEYFRVAYYGKGFPGFLQNKVFVYRGYGYERLADFQSRVLDQFPNAELLTRLEAPEMEKQNSPEQFIQVNKVDCVVEENKFTKPGVAECIRQFYNSNMVDKFTYSRPYHLQPRDKENEFATLCLERTTLTTQQKLPGILRCFPVKTAETVQLDPLLNAIDQMRENNKELQYLVLSHELRPDQALDSLTRKLNGMIDAAVMGGVSNYEKAFLQDSYLEKNPDRTRDIEDLKQEIRIMVPLLGLGLMVHQERVQGDITALHDFMLERFETMQKDLSAKYGSAEYPDINVKRRTLRPLKVKRQTSLDGSVNGGRHSSFPATGDLASSSSRLSIGSAAGATLTRSKSSNPKPKAESIRDFFRRDSNASMSPVPQSQFYDKHERHSTVMEITETLVHMRPPRPDTGDRRSRPPSISSISEAPERSRPPSVTSVREESDIYSSSTSVTASSLGGSVEHLAVPQEDSLTQTTDAPPPLPIKTKNLNPNRLSSRVSFLDPSENPPEKPPRPQVILQAAGVADTNILNNNVYNANSSASQ